MMILITPRLIARLLSKVIPQATAKQYAFDKMRNYPSP
jgi:hypothetical protein